VRASRAAESFEPRLVHDWRILLKTVSTNLGLRRTYHCSAVMPDLGLPIPGTTELVRGGYFRYGSAPLIHAAVVFRAPAWQAS
jgi:hypothetical protein